MACLAFRRQARIFNSVYAASAALGFEQLQHTVGAAWYSQARTCAGGASNLGAPPGQQRAGTGGCTTRTLQKHTLLGLSRRPGERAQGAGVSLPLRPVMQVQKRIFVAHHRMLLALLFFFFFFFSLKSDRRWAVFRIDRCRMCHVQLIWHVTRL
ncbi:hypothetical protein IWX91DRAFT_345207, partial [Phyllosticta citricarpa]